MIHYNLDWIQWIVYYPVQIIMDSPLWHYPVRVQDFEHALCEFIYMGVCELLCNSFVIFLFVPITAFLVYCVNYLTRVLRWCYYIPCVITLVLCTHRISAPCNVSMYITMSTCYIYPFSIYIGSCWVTFTPLAYI